MQPRGKKQIQLIANGDLRLSANQKCWAAQEGMEVFRKIDPQAPLIVAEAVWQYSHHVLHGLLTHRGPILTVANWSGQWPGLVGMLNLNGSMTKAGVGYSTIWSEDFKDKFFTKYLAEWLRKGKAKHRTDHVTALSEIRIPDRERKLGKKLAADLQRDKTIIGVFDEGCMGMYNAIIPDELLHQTGVFKERLSQSALYYETTQVSDHEAAQARAWLEDRGMNFVIGPREEEHLTWPQVQLQCKMYIAAARLADDFGCEAIGIQYQQGLKDLLPASDLVEGMLNNSQRPPARTRDGSRIIRDGAPIVHFNEVDECAGLDGLITNRIHKALNQPVENTLHDLRWGDVDRSGTVADYVWVFLISGSAPPAHFIDGWRGASSERQPPMYFRLGGGTLKGISKPGEIVWSRIYVEDGRLKMDLGRAGVVELPRSETQRRWNLTTPQWPIMHAVTYGVSRDQMMARHKANHIQVAYAKSAADADRAMMVKAAMAEALGMEVSVCGSGKNGKKWA